MAAVENNVLSLNDVESFFFLYNCLWSSSKEPDLKRSHLNIPDVILFQDGKPFRWLFTSDIEGDVMKKKSDKLKMVPIIVKTFKTKSAMMRNGKVNNNPSKIATLWISSVEGVSCALLNEKELATLLYSVYTEEKEYPTTLYEIMAIQVYFGGHTATPLVTNGVYEHRCYSRRNPDTGQITPGKFHESFEQVLYDKHSRPIVSTYSPNTDRLQIGEGQHNILSSLSNVLTEIIESAHKVKVSNIVLQVSFTANWIPLVVAIRSVLLTNIDGDYLSSHRKKHMLIYPIDILPQAKDLFNLQEMLPKAMFEGKMDHLSASKANEKRDPIALLPDGGGYHLGGFVGETAASAAHGNHMYSSGCYGDGKYSSSDNHSHQAASHINYGNKNSSSNNSSSNFAATGTDTMASAIVNNFTFNSSSKSDVKLDQYGITIIDKHKPASSVDYQQNDLSEEKYRQEIDKKNNFNKQTKMLKKTVSLFEKLKKSNGHSNGNSPNLNMTCKPTIDHFNIMTEASRGKYTRGVYDRQLNDMAQFRESIGIGGSTDNKDSMVGNGKGVAKRPTSATIHDVQGALALSGHESSTSQERQLYSQHDDGWRGVSSGDPGDNENRAARSNKNWFTPIVHHCQGDFCNIGMAYKPNCSIVNKNSLVNTGLQSTDSMATISKSGFLDDNISEGVGAAGKATRNISYIKPFKSILLARTEIAYTGKDIDNDTDGMWRTRTLAKEVDQVVIFYTKRQILRVLRKCSNDSLSNADLIGKAGSDSVMAAVNGAYQRMVYNVALSKVKPSLFYGTAKLCGVCYQIYTGLDQFRDYLILKNAAQRSLSAKILAPPTDRGLVVAFDLNQDDNPKPQRPESAPLQRIVIEGNSLDGSQIKHASQSMHNSLTFSPEQKPLNASTDGSPEERGGEVDMYDDGYDELDDQLNNTNIAVIYDDGNNDDNEAVVATGRRSKKGHIEPPVPQSGEECQGKSMNLAKLKSTGSLLGMSNVDVFYSKENARSLKSTSKLLTHNLPVGHVLGTVNRSSPIDQNILRSSTTSLNSVFSEINRGQGMTSAKTLSAWIGMFKDAEMAMRPEGGQGEEKEEVPKAYKDSRIKISKSNPNIRDSFDINKERFNKEADGALIWRPKHEDISLKGVISSMYPIDEDNPIATNLRVPKQRPKSGLSYTRAKASEIRAASRINNKDGRTDEKNFIEAAGPRMVEGLLHGIRDVYTKTNEELLSPSKVKGNKARKDWDNRFPFSGNQEQGKKRPVSASATSSRRSSNNNSCNNPAAGAPPLKIAPPQVLDNFDQHMPQYYSDSFADNFAYTYNVDVSINGNNKASREALRTESEHSRRDGAIRPSSASERLSGAIKPPLAVQGGKLVDGIASMKTSVDFSNRQFSAGGGNGPIDEATFAFAVGAPMLPLEESLSFILEDEQSNTIAMASTEIGSIDLNNNYNSDENLNSDTLNGADSIVNPIVDGNAKVALDARSTYVVSLVPTSAKTESDNLDETTAHISTMAHLRDNNPEIVDFIYKSSREDQPTNQVTDVRVPILVSRYSGVNVVDDDVIGGGGGGGGEDGEYTADFELSVDYEETAATRERMSKSVEGLKVQAANFEPNVLEGIEMPHLVEVLDKTAEPDVLRSASKAIYPTSPQAIASNNTAKLIAAVISEETTKAVALAREQYNLGSLEQSLRTAQEHLSKIKVVGGGECPPTDHVAMLLHIGLIHKEKTDYDRAKVSFEEALALSNSSNGVDSLSSAAVTASLGDLYSLFDFVKAKGFYSSALNVVNGMSSSKTSIIKHSASVILVKMRILVGMAYINLERGIFASFSLNIDELSSLLDVVGVGSGFMSESSDLDAIRAHYHILTSRFLMITGSYSDASESVKQAKDICSERGGTNSYLFASILGTQAYISLLQCDVSSALKLLEESFMLQEKLTVSNHPSIADTLQVKAEMLVECGDFNGAIESIQHALTIRRKIFGEKHYIIHSTLVALCKVYEARGFPQMADATFKDANAVFEGLDKSHKTFADIWELNSVMAYNLLLSGNICDAIEGFCASVAMAEKAQSSLFGRISENVSAITKLFECKIDLCLAYLLYGDIEKVEPIISYYTKTVKESFGERHKYFAKCMYVLGEYCSMRGNFSESDKCFSRSMGVLVQIYDKRPTPLSINCLIGASQNSRRLGNYDNAIHLANLAVTLIKSSCGENSIYEAQALQSIAESLRDEGKLEEAEEVYSTADEIFMECVGVNNLYYAKFMGSLGAYLRAAGQVEEAIKCLKKALMLQKNLFFSNSPVICETLCEITMCLLANGEVDVAIASMTNELMPYARETMGLDHPMTLYIIALHATTVKSMHGDGDEKDEETRAQFSYIDSALACFKELELPETHPWVANIKGYS